MLDNEQVRLIVNVDDLRDYDRTYADGCVRTWILDKS
jgi:DNA replication licensing factor MCM3